EGGTDPRIEPYRSRHVDNVGTHELADVRDLVDEADLRGEERVRRVLHGLCRQESCADQRRLTTRVTAAEPLLQDRPVDVHHPLDGGRIITSQDNAVRVEEVVYRGALAEELWVRDNREIAAEFLEQSAEPSGATDRDRALGHKDMPSVGAARDGSCRRRDGAHIGAAIWARGCADAQKHD